MIPVNTPLLNGNEEKYLVECVRTGWISSEGPFIKIFEDKFAAYVQRTHGIAAVSYTHLRAHETVLDLVCRLLLEKKTKKTRKKIKKKIKKNKNKKKKNKANDKRETSL